MLFHDAARSFLNTERQILSLASILFSPCAFLTLQNWLDIYENSMKTFFPRTRTKAPSLSLSCYPPQKHKHAK